MNFPVWEPALPNSILIAVVAIVHVFISHFAIGGGLYLVVAEMIARKKNSAAYLGYLKRMSGFFVLVTLVGGAVTGVGIWITIGLIHPTATTWLIRNFVWGWATEWVAFFIEIAAAIMYYYGWKRLTAKAHLTIGWIYFIAAWLSLFIINGIITFMLTPGKWLQTGDFFDGFFNPTFWPSLVFRTCIALTLAGLFAIILLSREKDKTFKARAMRINGAVILGGVLLAAPAGLWYFGMVPDNLMIAMQPGSVAMLAVQITVVAAAALVFLTLLGAIIFPRHSGYISAGILMLCGLMAMGGFEWAREAIRKPFVIGEYLYSNNLTVPQAKALTGEEPLTIDYSTGDHGRDLYLAACRSCHAVSGYQGLDRLVAGLEMEHLENIIPRLQHYISPMPPFPGDAGDVTMLAEYLTTIAAHDPLDGHLAEAPTEQRAALVFDRRCGGCHTMDGYRPLAPTFDGLADDEAADFIDMIGDLTPEMPPFVGDERELKLLIYHLTGKEVQP